MSCDFEKQWSFEVASLALESLMFGVPFVDCTTVKDIAPPYRSARLQLGCSCKRAGSGSTRFCLDGRILQCPHQEQADTSSLAQR